jgi:integrase
MIERSPFERWKSLMVKENNKRIWLITEDEIGKLLGECPKHVRQVVMGALNTGMRRDEILSLQWSQVMRGFIHLQKTKTNESRQIPISNDLEALFAEVRKSQGFGVKHVFTFAKGEDKLKGSTPVKNRRGPAPARVINVRTAFHPN